MLPESLQPYAKAVYPFVLSLIAVGVQWAVTGSYDRAELATQLTGLLAALVTLLVPNGAAVHFEGGDPPDDDGRTTLGTLL